MVREINFVYKILVIQNFVYTNGVIHFVILIDMHKKLCLLLKKKEKC